MKGLAQGESAPIMGQTGGAWGAGNFDAFAPGAPIKVNWWLINTPEQ